MISLKPRKTLLPIKKTLLSTPRFSDEDHVSEAGAGARGTGHGRGRGSAICFSSFEYNSYFFHHWEYPHESEIKVFSGHVIGSG